MLCYLTTETAERIGGRMGMIEIPIKRREPVMRWIPCSERLPEEDGEYLCDYNGHIHIGQMINKHFRLYGNIVDHLITAWQPLPEPYKDGDAE